MVVGSALPDADSISFSSHIPFDGVAIPRELPVPVLLHLRRWLGQLPSQRHSTTSGERIVLVSAWGALLLLLGMSLVPIVSLLLFVVAVIYLPRLRIRAALQRPHWWQLCALPPDRYVSDEVFEETCPFEMDAAVDSVSRRRIARFPFI